MKIIAGYYFNNIKFEKSICGTYDCFIAKLMVENIIITATNKGGHWRITQEDVFGYGSTATIILNKIQEMFLEQKTA
ncbi:hypothetical protein [Priestia aryabhattai]|uniref:hypothetical protein n=1 Tax=Priestia aryabhattai TaxID=412384 RepID=UPI0015F63861|nr:hypothetical protein [Priestia aryabhattai]